MYLVASVIKHTKTCNSVRTLVAISPFWPILCPDSISFAPFVLCAAQLPNVDDLIVPGKTGTIPLLGVLALGSVLFPVCRIDP